MVLNFLPSEFMDPSTEKVPSLQASIKTAREVLSAVKDGKQHNDRYLLNFAAASSKSLIFI